MELILMVNPNVDEDEDAETALVRADEVRAWKKAGWKVVYGHPTNQPADEQTEEAATAG